MKKLILLIFIIITTLCSSCCDKIEEFTGYIVHKEYVPEHYGTNNEVIYQEATFSPAIHAGAIAASHAARQRNKEYQENEKHFPSEWTIWVANKERVINTNIDSLSYFGLKCGEKVSVKNIICK